MNRPELSMWGCWCGLTISVSTPPQDVLERRWPGALDLDTVACPACTRGMQRVPASMVRLQLEAGGCPPLGMPDLGDEELS